MSQKMKKKTMWVFISQKYGKFRSILLEHFISINLLFLKSIYFMVKIVTQVPIYLYIIQYIWIKKNLLLFKKGKILMLLSLACWIGFTVPIGHIHPPVVSCKFYNDTTDQIYLQEPKTYDEAKRKKRSLAILTPGK